MDLAWFCRAANTPGPGRGGPTNGGLRGPTKGGRAAAGCAGAFGTTGLTTSEATLATGGCVATVGKGRAAGAGLAGTGLDNTGATEA